MKNNKIILFVLLIIFYSCSPEEKIEEELQKEYFIGLTNTIAQSRKDEPFVISRKTLEELTTVFPTGTVPLILGEDNEEVPVQTDDLNGDGIWDEISFIYSVLPKYTAPLKIEVIPSSSASNYKKRTNATIYELDEDNESETKSEKSLGARGTASLYAVAWENDKLAFKVQFHPKIEREIIGKRTQRMILNKRDFEKQGFMVRTRGKRLFHKSDSISPGATAFMVDSSYYKIEDYDSVKYEIIAQGPVRSVIKINFHGIRIKDKKFDLEEKITIWARHQGYSSLLSLPNFEEEQIMATAIPQEGTDSLAFSEMQGQYYAFASYNFKENDELEAFGIVLPQSQTFYADSTFYVDSIRSQPKDDVYVPFEVGGKRSVQLYYYFGWQGEDKYYKDPDAFHSMLDKEINRIKNPIIIDKYIPE